MTTKKLTLSAVHKESAKLNEKITKTITDRSGNEYKVIINKYFKKTDISKLIGDFVTITEQLKENGSNIEDYSDNIYLFHLLIIKYMTNIPLPSNALELIAYAQELINIDILANIINSLPQEEVDKASGWINESLKNLPEIMSKMVGMISKNLDKEMENIDQDK
jgi:hypothetical protein